MSHEVINAEKLSTREAYALMTSLVAPRPIAWVSSVSREGVPNLAPFSYYQAVCSKPPMVTLAFSHRADGSPKDTLRNILDTREFCVSTVSRMHLEAMNATSIDDPACNEWELPQMEGLHTAPSNHIFAPRVAEALAALECRMMHALPLGQGAKGAPSTTLIVAQVLCITLAEGLGNRDARGQWLPIDPTKLASVGRLGGIAYTSCEDVLMLARPEVGKHGG